MLAAHIESGLNLNCVVPIQPHVCGIVLWDAHVNDVRHFDAGPVTGDSTH